MPEMDGFAMAEEIRNLKIRKTLLRQGRRLPGVMGFGKQINRPSKVPGV